MRTTSPSKTRASTSWGRGGDLVCGSDSCTRTVTVAPVTLPAVSCTWKAARAVSARFGAW